MGNFSSRDLFTHAVNFTQSQIALQMSRIFYKWPLFMQNKANLLKDEINAKPFNPEDYENEPRMCMQGKQSQTKPITSRD